MPVHTSYRCTSRLRVHHPTAPAALPFHASLVVVLVTLALPALIVAEHVLPAPIAHAAHRDLLICSGHCSARQSRRCQSGRPCPAHDELRIGRRLLLRVGRHRDRPGGSQAGTARLHAAGRGAGCGGRCMRDSHVKPSALGSKQVPFASEQPDHFNEAELVGEHPDARDCAENGDPGAPWRQVARQCA
jgi:hypothetical protein